MQVMRDSTSITDPTLIPLIARLIEGLADYDCELEEMVRVVVIDPGDALTTIDADGGCQGSCRVRVVI